MKVKVNWDTDDECIDELPNTVDIPEYIDEEEIANYLSDTFGFCITSLEQA